jgi:hypothetical protein
MFRRLEPIDSDHHCHLPEMVGQRASRSTRVVVGGGGESYVAVEV